MTVWDAEMAFVCENFQAKCSRGRLQEYAHDRCGIRLRSSSFVTISSELDSKAYGLQHEVTFETFAPLFPRFSIIHGALAQPKLPSTTRRVPRNRGLIFIFAQQPYSEQYTHMLLTSPLPPPRDLSHRGPHDRRPAQEKTQQQHTCSENSENSVYLQPIINIRAPDPANLQILRSLLSTSEPASTRCTAPMDQGSYRAHLFGLRPADARPCNHLVSWQQKSALKVDPDEIDGVRGSRDAAAWLRGPLATKRAGRVFPKGRPGAYLRVAPCRCSAGWSPGYGLSVRRRWR